MLRVAVHVEGIREAASRFGRAPEIVMAELAVANRLAAEAAREEIEARTPVKTGRLKGAINTKVNQLHGEVRATVSLERVPYARHVEEGTRAHTIVPRSKKALAFSVGGRTVFAKSVQHPGTSGAFMFRDGIKAVEPRARAIFVRANREIARKLTG